MGWNFKKYFCLVTLIYVIVFLLSIFVFPQLFGNMHEEISADQLRINSINITPMSAFSKLIVLNVVVSFLILFSGALGTELFPITILAYNAFSFGEVIARINKPDTINMMYSFLPHTTIEIPTIIFCTTFACCYALKIQKLTGNEGIKGVLSYKGSVTMVILKRLIRPYLLYILPLIIIGCIIESTISLYIMRAIFNGV